MSSEKEESIRKELHTFDKEELIKLALRLQEKIGEIKEEIHKIRRQTLKEDEQLRTAETKIALLVDEREYAYSTAWTETITEETEGNSWMLQRISALNREATDITRRYDTLNDFTKNLIYEKKLSADFETPKIITSEIQRLEEELAALRHLRNEKKISEITEEALADYVQGHKEDVNLISEANIQTKKEKVLVNDALERKERKLLRYLDKLEKHKYSCVEVKGKIWRLLPEKEAEELKAKLNAPPAAEEISDVDECE